MPCSVFVRPPLLLHSLFKAIDIKQSTFQAFVFYRTCAFSFFVLITIHYHAKYTRHAKTCTCTCT